MSLPSIDERSIADFVAALEDLKAVAHRPEDMKDIRALVELHAAGMDFARIRHHLRDFAEVLEMPELLADVETLLAAHPPKPRKRKPRAPS